MAHGPGFDPTLHNLLSSEQAEKPTREQEPVFRREFEVKIVPPNLAEFTQLLEERGGVLETPRRKIRDEGYRLPEGSARGKKRIFEIHKEAFDSDEQNLAHAMNALHLLTTQEPAVGAELVLVRRPSTLPRCNARIRFDGEGAEQTMWLTVKRTDEQSMASTVKEVAEENAQLKPEWVQHVRELLKSLGYKHRITREKYRATYQFGEGHVETNEYPVAGVAPTAEIEAPTEQAVYELLDRLGYSRDAAKKWSDGDYYKELTIPKEVRNNAIFAEQSLLDIANEEHGSQ